MKMQVGLILLSIVISRCRHPRRMGVVNIICPMSSLLRRSVHIVFQSYHSHTRMAVESKVVDSGQRSATVGNATGNGNGNGDSKRLGAAVGQSWQNEGWEV
jgi:hypothetical protein